jgi:hypothetical protein
MDGDRPCLANMGCMAAMRLSRLFFWAVVSVEMQLLGMWLLRWLRRGTLRIAAAQDEF